MSAISVGGDLIHYEVLGRGRQVVLIHGWIGAWRYWIPTMQQLQTKYRVYALDLYGFGDSSKNPAKYTLEHQVALLADFMKDLGMPKAALVGHGMGALVATEFARQYPEQVPRMMLVSPPLFDPGDLATRVPAGRKILLTANRPGAAAPASTTPPAAAPALTGAEAAAAALNLPPSEGEGENTKTIMSASVAMRAALQEAARNRAAGTGIGPTNTMPAPLTDLSPMPRSPEEPQHNPLPSLVADPMAMLGKAFRKNEPEYDKLSVDIAKADPMALKKVVEIYDSGRMLDTLRQLNTATVLMHGEADTLFPMPNEQMMNYMTVDKENLVLPLVLPGVRHFPMLEYGGFFRVLSDFLEAPDVSKLELKEMWKRRTR